MIHTFIVQVAKRDDLPDTNINSSLIRHLLADGAWLEVVDVDELAHDEQILTLMVNEPTPILINPKQGDRK